MKPVLPPSDSVHNFVYEQCLLWIKNNCDTEQTSWATIQPNADLIKYFYHTEWDDMFLFIFPPRTKNDIGIRNIQITDILALSIELDEEVFWDVVNSSEIHIHF